MQTLNENIPKKIIRYRKDSTILDKGSESVNEMYFLEFYNNPLKQDVRYEAHYYCAIPFDDITIWQVSIYTFLSGCRPP